MRPASKGASTSAAAAARAATDPRWWPLDAGMALVNDAVRPDALLQPGPDLARRPSLSHLAGDEAPHVQAVVGVVVVEHAQPPGRDEVVGGSAHALVDAAEALAKVDRIHGIEVAEAPDEAAFEAVGRGEARVHERVEAAPHELVVRGRPHGVAGVAGEVAADGGAVGRAQARVHRLLLEHPVE